MTLFERSLRGRIAADGAVTVEAYMDACNAHYYATRDPLGGGGDFTTAPEVSQIFGELVGAALADCWSRAGSPANALYAEIGPGRGTLAADALRVLRSAGFAGEIHLVETSPVLRQRQAQAVPDAQWHDSLDALPPRPPLMVANEFLDALPIRQFVGPDERHVVVAGGELAFDRRGEIVERSPQREAAVTQVAEHLVRHGGVAIVIDYGHALGGPGDTLQAVRGHQYAPVLARPGEQDLTSHVDFGAVARAASAAGASVSDLVTQRDWLNRLGIGARAATLADANPERVGELATAVQRLTGRDQMGELFKVLAVYASEWPEPAGFA